MNKLILELNNKKSKGDLQVNNKVNTAAEEIDKLINNLVFETINASESYQEAKKKLREQAYRFTEAPSKTKDFVINSALTKIVNISLSQKTKN